MSKADQKAFLRRVSGLFLLVRISFVCETGWLHVFLIRAGLRVPEFMRVVREAHQNACYIGGGISRVGDLVFLDFARDVEDESTRLEEAGSF